jgi:hypothetical protein
LISDEKLSEARSTPLKGREVPGPQNSREESQLNAVMTRPADRTVMKVVLLKRLQRLEEAQGPGVDLQNSKSVSLKSCRRNTLARAISSP